MINKIKEIFKDKIYNSARLTKALKDNPDIKEYCQQILNKIPEYQKVSYVIISIIKDMQLKKCKYCGKYLTYTASINNGIYCSKTCKWNDPDWKNKCANKTISEETKLKAKQTCLKKYGVENISQLESTKERKRHTVLKHFGVEHPMQSKEILNKSKQTLLTKYGVEHISQVQSIKDRKKRKQYILNFKKLSKYSDYVLPNFTVEDYLKNGINNQSWICVKCGKTFVQKYMHSTGHIYELSCCPRCLDCYPFVSGYSYKEKEVVDFIKSIYNGEIIENTRKLISPLELDIVIPEKKLAIEFNGNYWHSEQSGTDKNYHLNKTNLCEQKGYQLIHIFQYQWSNLQKQNILKEKLKYLLGIDQKVIYARKCIIKEISTKEKNKFLNENHIQGEDKSKVKLGLFFENKLVSVMTFVKPRFNKNYQWELSRFASLNGYRIVGGASKLLKYFEITYKPKSLITYADRRYSKGNLYTKLGFNLDHISKPNFVWMKDDHSKILNRLQCFKKNVQKMFDDYDNNLSISENLIKHFFIRIFDCGNLVYIKKYI
mgnify:CR=1 FL=1